MDVSVASKERFIHHFIAAVTISCRPPLSLPQNARRGILTKIWFPEVDKFPIGLELVLQHLADKLDLI